MQSLERESGHEKETGTALILFPTRHYGRRMDAITESLNDLADDMGELICEAEEQTGKHRD